MFCQVWNDARIAARSLPFKTPRAPSSFIQNGTGIDDHFGLSPAEVVMRV
jgi:hypothetical protein